MLYNVFSGTSGRIADPTKANTTTFFGATYLERALFHLLLCFNMSDARVSPTFLYSFGNNNFIFKKDFIMDIKKRRENAIYELDYSLVTNDWEEGRSNMIQLLDSIYSTDYIDTCVLIHNTHRALRSVCDSMRPLLAYLAWVCILGPHGFITDDMLRMEAIRELLTPQSLCPYGIK